MVGVAGSEKLRDTTLAEFAKDLEAWRAVKRAPPATSTDRLLTRSCFNDVAVQQWVEAVFVPVCCC